MLCGLQKGEMTIVAARPSMGKTSLALNIAEHIGADNNVPTVIFSLEMGKHQLVERLLCSRGHIDSQLVRNGTLNSDQFEKLTRTSGELFEKPIYIDDTPALSILEMRTKARRLQVEKGVDLLIVDYLQLARSRNLENRVQEVSEISQGLKK